MIWLSGHASVIGLLLALALVVLSMYRAHHDPLVHFNLLDLLMENGRVSKIACTFVATFAFTTWLMVHLTLKGAMTEGYLTIYGTFWVTPLVARVIFGKTGGDAPKVA